MVHSLSYEETIVTFLGYSMLATTAGQSTKRVFDKPKKIAKNNRVKRHVWFSQPSW
jgi:hypothetical protein